MYLLGAGEGDGVGVSLVESVVVCWAQVWV
jgi:hypothetical protein